MHFMVFLRSRYRMGNIFFCCLNLEFKFFFGVLEIPDIYFFFLGGGGG